MVNKNYKTLEEDNTKMRGEFDVFASESWRLESDLNSRITTLEDENKTLKLWKESIIEQKKHLQDTVEMMRCFDEGIVDTEEEVDLLDKIEFQHKEKI